MHQYCFLSYCLEKANITFHKPGKDITGKSPTSQPHTLSKLSERPKLNMVELPSQITVILQPQQSGFSQHSIPHLINS
jgi:hypothetical protein